jgi:hypothetical protein
MLCDRHLTSVLQERWKIRILTTVREPSENPGQAEGPGMRTGDTRRSILARLVAWRANNLGRKSIVMCLTSYQREPHWQAIGINCRMNFPGQTAA